MSQPIRWIPVVEQMPPEGEPVVVSRDVPLAGRPHNFPAFLVGVGEEANWHALVVTSSVTSNDWRNNDGPVLGGVRPTRVQATDFWLRLPKEPPDFNCFDGGWPA